MFNISFSAPSNIVFPLCISIAGNSNNVIAALSNFSVDNIKCFDFAVKICQFFWRIVNFRI